MLTLLSISFGPVKSSACLTNDECGMIQECIDLAEEGMNPDDIYQSEDDNEDG